MLAYITFFIIFLGFIIYHLILIVPMRSVGVALLATEWPHATARKRRTSADARGQSLQ